MDEREATGVPMSVRTQFRRWRALQWAANSTVQIELMAIADGIATGDHELARAAIAWLIYDKPYRWSQVRRATPDVMWLG